jgi:gas vesicle protein
MSRTHSSSDDAPLLTGLLLGLLGGTLLGLLFAPKHGEANNRDINRFLKHLPERLADESPSSTFAFVKKAGIYIEKGVNRVKRAVEADKLAQAKRREEAVVMADELTASES